MDTDDTTPAVPDDTGATTSRGHLSRRAFLGALAGVGLAGGGVLVGKGLDQDEPARMSFHGEHQPGVTTPGPSDAIVAAFDTTAGSRHELASTLKALSGEADKLMSGVVDPDKGPLYPPPDSMIIGPTPQPADLTVTIALGASLFDNRFGLADHKPRRLRPMDHFPNDQIDRARADGDLLIQICASSPEACNHALRRLMRATRATLTLRWLMPGFQQPNTLSGGRTSTRNLLGFKDGTANPDAASRREMDDLVWLHSSDDPAAWTVGGTYMVVRLIRNRVEFWDRTPTLAQERIFGRHKVSGAPLGHPDEATEPDYASDPKGTRIPLNSHIRLANPRTEQAKRTRMLRRGFSYASGFTPDGQLDQGLIFVCFQRDLDEAFVATQSRLDGEPLEEYITPVGGGYFFVPPGARTPGDWVGSGLFT